MNDFKAGSLTIRMAGPDDAAVLAEMIGELAEYERLGDINRSTEETLRAELSAPDSVLQACIAFEGETPVGMATFFTTYSTFAAKRGLYLEDLFVQQDGRHHGYGTELLRYVARYAVERDCGRMEWTTLLWNTVAIEFYEALGATPNDAWTTYRLIGDSLKRLASAQLDDKAARA
ncbi:MAG: GNAT family N-acetyltransferase [Planctomycetota bacterium]|jgi:GNAT superfamily N-acetyltransferase|nr:GNAT family N-acetyltransferase [Planctomycetota bacterium]